MGQSVSVTMQFLASFSIAQSFMTLMCHLQVTVIAHCSCMSAHPAVLRIHACD